MIASLLPGIRELRNPLAAGSLWIVVLWLSLREVIPSRGNAVGLVADVYNLIEQFGFPALIAVLAFCAYVLGVLLSALTNALLAVAQRTYINLFSERRDVQQLIEDAVTRAQKRKSTADEINVAMAKKTVGKSALEDERLLAIRLRSISSGVFDDYDRARGEAEFRFAIALPLIGVGIALTCTTPDKSAWWAIGGAAAGVALLLYGAVRLRQSDEILYHALATEVIESPTVKALNGLKGHRPKGDQTTSPTKTHRHEGDDPSA